MKINHLFMVVLFTLILLAGCANKSVSLVDETIKEDFVPTMTLQLINNGVESSIERKAHKWEEKLSSEESRASFIDYSPPAIHLKANQKVNLMFDNDPKLLFYLVVENGRLEEISLEKNEFIASVEKGHYKYQVNAEWSNLKATFGFDVEVHE